MKRTKKTNYLLLTLVIAFLAWGCGKPANNVVPPAPAGNATTSTPSNTGTINTGNPNTSTAAISLEDAKKIALNQVPGAGEQDIHIVQEYDDGRLIYEGTILYEQMEYDFEIDAATGNIRDWSMDSIFD